MEYVDLKKCVPSDKTIYKDVKIGKFWTNINHGGNKQLYTDTLSKNDILKEKYEELNKKREENKEIKQYTPTEKAVLLLEYVEEKKCVPFTKEVYKDVKIGSFWQSIKGGTNKQLYINLLSKNNILKENYDKRNKNKEGMLIQRNDNMMN